jgi:hypothetical protein
VAGHRHCRIQTPDRQARPSTSARAVCTDHWHRPRCGPRISSRDSPSARNISGRDAGESPRVGDTDAPRVSRAASRRPEHRTSERVLQSRSTDRKSEGKIIVKTSQPLSTNQPRRKGDIDRLPSTSVHGPSLLRHPVLASDRKASAASTRSEMSDSSTCSQLGRITDGYSDRPLTTTAFPSAHELSKDSSGVFVIGQASDGEEESQNTRVQSRQSSQRRSHQTNSRATKATGRPPSLSVPCGPRVIDNREPSKELATRFTPSQQRAEGRWRLPAPPASEVGEMRS